VGTQLFASILFVTAVRTLFGHEGDVRQNAYER